MKRLLIVLALCGLGWAQTYTYPAKEKDNVFTGNNTFTRPITLGADPTLNLQAATKQYVDGKVIGAVVNVEKLSGATADVKLAACLSALPNGGTCDARGFGATTQTIAATVSTSSTKPTELLFDRATKFQPASDGLLMFSLGPHTHLRGITIDTTNRPSFTGTAVKTQGNIEGDWVLADSEITLSQDAGVCVNLHGAASTASVVFARVDNVVCKGGRNGLLLSTATDGWVNANLITNFTANASHHGFELYVAGSGIGGNQISQNWIMGSSSEYLGSAYAVDAVLISTPGGGSATAVENVFDLNTFDYPGTTVNITGFACRNQFRGAIYTWNDAGTCGASTYLDSLNPTFYRLTAWRYTAKNYPSVVGSVTLESGDAGNSGFVGFYNALGTRNGYLGYDSNSNVSMHLENGGKFAVKDGNFFSQNGADLNNAGITNAGAVAGATTVQASASVSVTRSSLYNSSTATYLDLGSINPDVVNTPGAYRYRLITEGDANGQLLKLRQMFRDTTTADIMTVNNNKSVTFTGGLDLSSIGISNTGSLAGVTSISGSGSQTMTGSTGLPAASTGNRLVWGAGYGSPTSGRLYFGDGSGWKFCFATRASSTDTDRTCFTDTGIVTANGGFNTGTLATGTAPVTTSSTTLNANFNADMLDSKHAADFPTKVSKISLTDQTAAIGWTDIVAAGSVTTGVYSFKSYLGIKVVSSAGWVNLYVRCNDGINAARQLQLYNCAATTTNASAGVCAGSAVLRCTAGTAIQYTTTLQSIGTPNPTYQFDLFTEQLP